MSADPIHAVFRLLRGTHPAAAVALVEQDRTDPATIWLHAVRAATGELLWFNEDYSRHPDADALGGSPELDYASDDLLEVETLLRAAYEGPEHDQFATASADDRRGVWRGESRVLLTVAAPA